VWTRNQRGEPAGWQRWRHQILKPLQDTVIVFAQGSYGIFQMAETPVLLRASRQDVPTSAGTRQQILAQYGLTAQG
jgi:hypothetical protein